MADIVHVKALDKKSRIKPTISFLSYKNNCHLFCESYLEVDCCLYREFEPSIVAYTTQPTTYSYIYHGKMRTYTPDALVYYKDGHLEFEEIKPVEKSIEPKFLEKFTFLQGIHKKVIKIDLVLNNGMFESKQHWLNCQKLYHFIGKPFDVDYWRINSRHLPVKLAMQELIHFLKKSNFDAVDMAYQLVARNIYSTDMNKEILITSELVKTNADSFY